MENVSKALIIAGGTLIAILIISLGINLASAMQKQSKAYYETLSTQEIAKINGEITKDFVKPFKDDSTNSQYITAQGIVTLNNLKEKLSNQGIYITIDGISLTNLDNFLKSKSLSDDGKIVYYVVEIQEYSNGGITKIRIQDSSVYQKEDDTGKRENIHI